jgi:hypothetical protein
LAPSPRAPVPQTATDEQWVQVERLANALYDEKLAREQLAESLRQEQQLRQQGARLTEQMRTPAERAGHDAAASG